MSENNQDESQQELPTATSPNINVNDLASIHNIIEVACSRAAFKPDELEVVGRLYNKLTAFLNQFKEQKNV